MNKLTYEDKKEIKLISLFKFILFMLGVFSSNVGMYLIINNIFYNININNFISNMLLIILPTLSSAYMIWLIYGFYVYGEESVMLNMLYCW